MADEKYRLTLEGSEIDEALLRLANYEDEGLVLGSRKGVMLGPGSEYYHKNARYYAELAQSAVPGDTTSAVRWDIDQSALTEADRELARKNIRAGGTNPNLLDNPWWGSGEVVNQRGVTSGNTDHLAYNIDRWQTSYGSVKGTWSLSAYGLTISASDVAYNQQKIENYTKLNGKTVTASVMTSDGVVHSGTVTNLNWASNPIAFTDGNLRCQLASGGIFRVTSLNGSSNTIRAVKLELGSVSTLANDAPPDYNSELRKCRYYFRRITNPAGGAQWCLTGMNATATVAIFVLDNPMRSATKTISYSGALQVNGVSVTSVGSYTRGHDTTLSVVTGGGLTVYGGAGLIIGANGYLDISADL